MVSTRSFLLASLAFSVGLSTQTPTSSRTSGRSVPYVNPGAPTSSGAPVSSGAPPLAGSSYALSADGTRTGVSFALEDPLTTDMAVEFLQTVSGRLGFTSSKCARVVSRSGSSIFNEDRCPSTPTPKAPVPAATPAASSPRTLDPSATFTPTPTDTFTLPPSATETPTPTATPTALPASGSARFARVLDSINARSLARRIAVVAQNPTITTPVPQPTSTKTAVPAAPMPMAPAAPPVTSTGFQAVAGSGVVVYSDGKVCYSATSCTHHYTLWVDGVEAATLEALTEDVATVMASVMQSLGLRRSGAVSYRVVSAEQAYVASPKAAAGIPSPTPTADDGKTWLMEAVEGYWWVVAIALVCFVVGVVCECVRQSCTRSRNRVKTYPMLR